MSSKPMVARAPASITGAFIALWDACQELVKSGRIKTFPITDNIAATSVGLVNDEALLDLCYTEDSTADVDMNIVMTGSGKFIEIQGTAEEKPFSRDDYNQMLDLSIGGIQQLIRLQNRMMLEDLDEAGIGDA
ncbi:Ribonuclease PH [Geodia barretti]|uniref:Ribonuclease PH n=1 Tax=Geodia barretti TaxID=519541 RepID=A0AA35RIJ3_GEOBA|nr:Ribonuclease PH [Geodia barretti]